jgi:DNA polymerase-1
VGEKGATQLLQEFKTLDGVYENLGLIKDSLRRKLEAGKDLAYLRKKLAAIWTDAPLPLDLDAMDGRKADPAKIQQLLQKLEFRSLARQLPEIMQVSADTLPATGQTVITPAKTVAIDADDDLAKLKLGTAKELVMAARAAGKHGKRPLVLVLSPDVKTSYVLDLTKLSKKALKESVAAVLADEGVAKIGYDLKSILKIGYELGLDIGGIDHDVQVAAFLINCLRREQALSDLAATELGYDGSPFEELDDEEYASRAGETIAVTRSLAAQQKAELKSMPKLPKLARDIEWPVIPVLARMEYAGIELDTDYLKKFSVEIDEAIHKSEQQIYEYAEQEFNIGSPTQLAEVLFEHMQLPKQGIKKGTTGYSTAASELDKLRAVHPIIDLITQYREVTKLKSTYVDTLPKQVDENSRVHTTYALTVAQTGRLSSNDPNLQNIPTRTDLGRHIRSAFVAGPGNKFVSADYSQFELRLAAVMAKDEELIDMFNRGVDVHTATAAQVYGRELEDVTKQMRRAAKVINFGILYGMSPHGLSVAAGMTFEQAMNFIEKYKNLRQPLFAYMDSIKEFARREGYVETIFGRRRPMPDIHSSNFMVRQAAERAAINMPIQGTEADLMKMAMAEVDKKLQAQHNNCRQLLQVHDSILVECPAEVAERVAKLLKDTMENIYELPVQLTVDTTVGDNWGEL